MKNKKKKINLKGLKCPITLLYVRKNLYTMKHGQNILIISDDPTTIKDIPNFCNFMNHTLLKKKIKKNFYTYLIKKGK